MLRPHAASRALALLLCCAPLALAQSGADFIPEDATFAITINSISGVRDKGEKFFKDHDIERAPRPSRLFNELYKLVGITKGVDEKGPAAFVLGNLEKAKPEEVEGFGILTHLYGVVPVKDVGEMAGNFKLKEADLKDGKAHPVADKKPLQVLLKGKFLYMGLRPDTLTRATAPKKLLDAVSPAQQVALTKSDVAMHFGARALGKLYGNWLDDAEKNLGTKDARDNSQARMLIDALRQLRYVSGGVSIGEGARANVIATFNTGKDGEAARKFLTKLRAGPGTSDLIGLPKGRPLFLFAAKGDGTSNVSMARALVNIFFEKGRIDRALPGEERREFIASFEKLYKELKGSRAALYDNGDPTKQGRLALVGILDIGDTEKHLAEMPNMTKRLNKAFENIFGKKAATVSFEKKAEKVGGLDVDLLRIKAPGLSKTDLKDLKDTFGPDWDRVRLAVVGKKVVFLAGSNTDLLKEAAANLEGEKKGLAGDKTVTAELGRLSKTRKVELHFNFEGLQSLQGGKKAPPLRGLTSFALTVEPDRLEVELAVSKSEVKALAAQMGHGRKDAPKERR